MRTGLIRAGMYLMGATLFVLQSNAIAGAMVDIRLTSQSGCYDATIAEQVETGTVEFREQLSRVIGMAEVVRETCPAVHVSVVPQAKRIGEP